MGFEPMIGGSKVRRIKPDYATSSIERLAVPRGLEPRCSDRQSGVLPLNDGTENWRDRTDSNRRDYVATSENFGAPTET